VEYIQEVVDLKSQLTFVPPPAAAAAVYISPRGYPNLEYIQEVVANYSAAGLPLETIWSGETKRQCGFRHCLHFIPGQHVVEGKL
jgi:hypothetical protein